jgi:hypothetical protein
VVASRLAAAPAVTTTASARVLHDTNLYLQNSAPLAAGQTAAALPDREGATALDAAAGVGLRWVGAHKATADLGYGAELFRYFGHSTEDHTDHTLSAGGAATAAGWSADAKARYLYVDGSDDSPIFSGLGGAPAIGGEPVRARREQAIARASGKVTREISAGFVRAVFSIYDQQFYTKERNLAGYANYADRNETSAGLEAGQGFGGLTVFAGVRAGFQRQANVLGVPLNYGNTFTRWLAGVEGAATKTLKVSFLAGPDLRHYGESVRSGFERSQHTGYGEAAVTWAATSADTLALTAKHYLWLSSAGRGAYADTVVDLSWRRKLSEAWSAGIGGNVHDGDTSHFNPWSPRHDHIYAGTLNVGRTLPHKLRLDCDVMHDWSRTYVINTPAREYSRWITSVALSGTW